MLAGRVRNNITRDGRGKLEALISAVGATTSPINLGIAKPTKHRDAAVMWALMLGSPALHRLITPACIASLSVTA